MVLNANLSALSGNAAWLLSKAEHELLTVNGISSQDSQNFQPKLGYVVLSQFSKLFAPLG